MNPSLLPFLAVLPGFLAVIPILLSRRHPNLREGWSFVAAGLQLAATLGLLASGTGTATPEIPLLPGAPLQFRADPLGLIFLTLASLLWLAAHPYSIGYLRAVKSGHQTGYYAAFSVAVGSAAGIALAANPLTFLIFYEILTISTWPLVAHRREAKGVLSSARSYLVYTLFAGQLLLAAVVWIGVLAPGASFTPGGFLEGAASDGTLRILFLLLLVGVGAKAALLPLHAWLPRAMVAPTPVSALLHAVAVVKAGAFGVLRVTGWAFGPDLMRELDLALPLAALAALTIVFASVRALGESHLKRRLAWSTVSQLSYIALGGAIGTPLALAGAAFHIAAHGFMKISLFFCAGAIYATTGREQIADLRGFGRAMPVTFAAFSTCALGMAGLPLLPGFLSKWNLALGGLQAGQPWVIALLILSGLLNLAYYFPILRVAWFESPTETGLREPGWWLAGPPAAAALIALVLGFFPDFGMGFWSLAAEAAQSVAEEVPASFALRISD